MTFVRTTLSVSSLIIAAAYVLSVPAAAQRTSHPPRELSSQSKTSKSNKKSASLDSSEPTLLGQYKAWGAYVADPGGKKVCFVLSKPKSEQASKKDVKRDQAYMFISTRPADKVKNEVSIILGYPLDPKTDTTAQVGSTTYMMLSQNDGAWIKNAKEEPDLVNAMRHGADMVVKATSSHGTHTTDTYSLMGVSAALSRANKECGGNG